MGTMLDRSEQVSSPLRERDKINFDWVLGYVIEFNDEGPVEEKVLFRGSYESCIEIGNKIPAVAYSGDRNVSQVKLVLLHDPSGEYK